MCLSTLTKKRKLRRDLKVWKVFRWMKVNKGKTGTHESFLNSKPYVFSTGVNFADEKCIRADSMQPYLSGYHCFRDKKDACDYPYYLSTEHKSFIKQVIIPKGTTIQIGEQNGAIVYVSPIIIIPEGVIE